METMDGQRKWKVCLMRDRKRLKYLNSHVMDKPGPPAPSTAVVVLEFPRFTVLKQTPHTPSTLPTSVILATQRGAACLDFVACRSTSEQFLRCPPSPRCLHYTHDSIASTPPFESHPNFGLHYREILWLRSAFGATTSAIASTSTSHSPTNTALASAANASGLTITLLGPTKNSSRPLGTDSPCGLHCKPAPFTSPLRTKPFFSTLHRPRKNFLTSAEAILSSLGEENINASPCQTQDRPKRM